VNGAVKHVNPIAFGLYADQIDAAFLRRGLQEAARIHALRVWCGMHEAEELGLLQRLAQARCEVTGYLCSAADIAKEEFKAALEVIDEHMAKAERLAVEAASIALQMGEDRRGTMEAVIAAVSGLEPLPPESLLISAAEKAFSRHRWQERAWTKQGGRTA